MAKRSKKHKAWFASGLIVLILLFVAYFVVAVYRSGWDVTFTNFVHYGVGGTLLAIMIYVGNELSKRK